MSARIKDGLFAGLLSLIVMFTVMPMMTETAYGMAEDGAKEVPYEISAYSDQNHFATDMN